MDKSKNNFNLQLGDIIKIISPYNDRYHNNIYYIKYIDFEKVVLINDVNEYTLEISQDKKLKEESIENIILLHREIESSFCKQNNLVVNTYISIYFNNEVPYILNGKITNIEEDMIEITSIPNKDVFYIDFAYSGIPLNLNIEKIVINEDLIEKTIDLDLDLDVESNESKELSEDLNTKSKSYEIDNEYNIKENIKLDNVDNEFRSYENYDYKDNITKDTNIIKLGSDVDNIEYTVNVDESEVRYDLDKQIDDYFDKHINILPIMERTNKNINLINKDIIRFKELRSFYSDFDINKYVKIKNYFDDNYKPLIDNNLINMNKEIEWLIPVCNNINTLINDGENELESDENLEIYKMGKFLENLLSENNKFYDKTKQLYNYYNYAKNNLNNLNDNKIPKKHINDNNIITVNDDINIMINNYDDYSNYVVKKNAIINDNYYFQNANTGLTCLESYFNKSKKLFKSVSLVDNDNIYIKGFLTLPLFYYFYSLKSNDYTNLLDKSNLSLIQTNNDNLFKKSNIREYLYSKTDFAKNISIDNIQNDKVFDKINYFYFDENIDSNNNYLNLLNLFIPNNNKVVSYLKNKFFILNYNDFVINHQGFNIDMYNINIKTYKLINKIITENIEHYKKSYEKNKNIFDNYIKYTTAKLVNKVTNDNKFIVLSFLNNEIKKDIFENYQIDISNNIYNDYEILNKIYELDDGEFLNSSINKNNSDLIVSNLLDSYIKKLKKSDKLDEESLKIEDLSDKTYKTIEKELEKKTSVPEQISTNTDNCYKYIISKKYGNIESLINDNNKKIFFDQYYDKTPYHIINNYSSELTTMDGYNFVKFLKKELINNYNINKNIALREAKAIYNKKKEIINGDYALFLNLENNKNYIYIRKNNIWELDEKFKNNFHIDSNLILCNTIDKCNYNNDKCLSKSDLQKNINDKLINQILENFNLDYNISVEEIKENINKTYINAKNKIKKINKYKNKINDFVDNNDNYIDDDKQNELVIISPYKYLCELIISQKDLVKKYNNIKKFCINFVREHYENENKYWLYCKTTNNKLMPIFYYKLANAFLNNENYSLVLDKICADQGTISDDNNYWVDKHSGYIIKHIEFSDDYIDETKLNKLEYDININVKNNEKLDKAENIVQVIIKAMSNFMKINLENYNEFIITNVIKLQNTSVPSKKMYQKKIETLSAKESKVKVMPSYEELYDSSLILFTLAYILVSIQISIPQIKSKKVFPGCIKSFSGYPIDGTQNKSGLIYIVCVANKIKSNIKPWNSINKINEANFLKKLEVIIDKYLINNKEIIELTIKKKEYLLQNKDSIDNEVNIENYNYFYPPLKDIEMNLSTLLPIRYDNLKEYITTIKKNDQDDMIEIIQSKNIYLSGAIIDSIQTTVKKNSIILSDYILENSCCNSDNNTSKFFINKDSNITRYNSIINDNTNFYNIIVSHNKSRILYCNINTRPKKIELSNKFDEIIIYKAFIYYCNFENNLSIDDELKKLCYDKPDKFDKTIDIYEKIEYLKSIGKIYSYDNLIDLIQYISKNNIIYNYNNNNIIDNTKYLHDILSNYNEKTSFNIFEDDFIKKILVLLNDYENSVDNSTNKELRSIKNYLGSFNDNNKQKIIEFMKTYSNLNKTLINNFNDNIEFEFDIKFVKIFKNYIFSFVNILPNIINNGNTNIVPKHWNISDIHKNDIRTIIERYYKNLNNLNEDNCKQYINIIYEHVKKRSDILINIIDNIFYIQEKTIDNKTISSIYDKDFVSYIFKFVVYNFINIYINILNDNTIKNKIISLPDFDNQKFYKIISKIIFTFVNMFYETYNLIEHSYSKLKSKINTAKEKEKVLITDFLKNLTDEEREIENIFKNNKLEKWSVGLQKGMTQYVKSNYDLEKMNLEKQIELENKLNKMDNVSQMNIDIYKFDFIEQQLQDEIIDKEEYNMNDVPDDDNYDDEILDTNEDDDIYIEDDISDIDD